MVIRAPPQWSQDALPAACSGDFHWPSCGNVLHSDGTSKGWPIPTTGFHLAPLVFMLNQIRGLARSGAPLRKSTEAPRGAQRTDDERLAHLDSRPLDRPGRGMRRAGDHQRRTCHPQPRATGGRRPRTPGRGQRSGKDLRRRHRGRRVRRGPLHRPQEGRRLPLRDPRLAAGPRHAPHQPHRGQDGRDGRLHPRGIGRQPPDAALRAARRPHHAAQALRHGRRRRHPRHRGVGRGELLRAHPRIVGDRGARPRFDKLGHRRHRLLRRRHALHIGAQLFPAPRLRSAAPRRRPQLHQPHAELSAECERASHADLGRRIASPTTH